LIISSQYVLYYPLDRKYISIFPESSNDTLKHSSSSVNTNADGSQIAEEMPIIARRRAEARAIAIENRNKDIQVRWLFPVIHWDMRPL